jgi:hypothetical protein
MMYIFNILNNGKVIKENYFATNNIHVVDIMKSILKADGFNFEVITK